MYTLWRPSAEAAYIARSRRSRASSTPRFEAASSSTTSRFAAPVQTRRQESHSPQGSPAGSPAAPRRSQFSAIARIRAAVVLDEQVEKELGAVFAGESDHGKKSTSNVEILPHFEILHSTLDIRHLYL